MALPPKLQNSTEIEARLVAEARECFDSQEGGEHFEVLEMVVAVNGLRVDQSGNVDKQGRLFDFEATDANKS